MNIRWWWNSHQNENLDEVNFLWTPWILDSEVQKLPCDLKPPNVTSREDENSNENGESLDVKYNLSQSHTVRNKLRMSSSLSALQSEENKGNAQMNKSIIAASRADNIVIKNGLELDHSRNKLYNKLEANFNLSSKKWLFINMKNYYSNLGQDVFDVIPLTFHIKNGENDPEFLNFKTYFGK